MGGGGGSEPNRSRSRPVTSPCCLVLHPAAGKAQGSAASSRSPGCSGRGLRRRAEGRETRPCARARGDGVRPQAAPCVDQRRGKVPRKADTPGLRPIGTANRAEPAEGSGGRQGTAGNARAARLTKAAAKPGAGQRGDRAVLVDSSDDLEERLVVAVHLQGGACAWVCARWCGGGADGQRSRH